MKELSDEKKSSTLGSRGISSNLGLSLPGELNEEEEEEDGDSNG